MRGAPDGHRLRHRRGRLSPLAVTLLLVSKGRSRKMPPPVLIPRLNALDGLATDVPAEARRLAETFWPGGLTLILHAQPSLDWDLGDTKGTVALRIPADDIAQDLLTLTGPLAVSSANRTGQPAARPRPTPKPSSPSPWRSTSKAAPPG